MSAFCATAIADEAACDEEEKGEAETEAEAEG